VISDAARLGPLAPPHAAGLERWFARTGSPPLLDLARSGAPALSAGELLRTAPPGALDALLDLSLDYDEGRGRAALREAIAQSGAARCAGEVLVTHGAVEALLLSCAALRVQGRRVLVATPAYEALLRTPAALGAQVEAVPVWSPGHDMLDLAPLQARITGDVAAVLVNSPANPTGAVATAPALHALATRCAETGATLVVDEVAVATLDDAAESASSNEAFAGGAIVAIGDLSKSCGLGGLRVGWLTTTPAPLLDAAAALKDLTSLGNAAPAELLATIALQQREALVAPVRHAALANLATLTAWIDAHSEAALSKPRDGLVALPFLPAAATTRFAERLRHRHGVSLVPGDLLGIPGHVRIGLGLAPHRFAEALDRLGAALRSPAG
jgi:aspartate/methionine/tyrosine aminotransferase